ncbi:MAG: hypothetical protein NT080_14170 [Spirochaetes bacterium]|nr:hypothetical protein [Spirochaetota bacterium]
MTLAGTVFSFVFTGNVVLRYGVGLMPSGMGSRSRIRGLALLPAAAVSTFLFQSARDLFMRPFGLDFLAPLLFLFMTGSVISLFGMAATALAGNRQRIEDGAKAVSTSLIEASSNGLLFSIAILVAGVELSLPDSFVAGLAASAGYWAATVLLESIARKLDSENIPRSLRGAPIYFISAGLVALAFAGLDQLFISSAGG